MISVIVPWRSADPHRIAAWDHVRPLWHELGVDLCVADDGRTEGPFSVSRAQNRARALARTDRLLMYGADQLPPTPERLAWIEARLDRHPWTAVYATTRIYWQEATAHIINGLSPAMFIKWSHLICMCTGILAMRTDVWDDLGGMDERFAGWGAEDTALRFALRTLHPAGNDAGEGELWSLWHPDTPRDALTAANSSMVAEYERAAARGELREYLQGVRCG